MKALVLVLLCFAGAAQAAPQFWVGVDAGGTTVHSYEVMTLQTFDVVVHVDSDGHDFSLYEFQIDDLVDGSWPGLLKIAQVIAGCEISTVDCYYEGRIGGHVPCQSGTAVPLARFTFMEVAPAGIVDRVVQLGGWTANHPGVPGIISCEVVPIDGEMGGSAGGVTGSGVVFPDGSLVLNPTPFVIEAQKMRVSRLKSRYFSPPISRSVESQ